MYEAELRNEKTGQSRFIKLARATSINQAAHMAKGIAKKTGEIFIGVTRW